MLFRAAVFIFVGPVARHSITIALIKLLTVDYQIIQIISFGATVSRGKGP